MKISLGTLLTLMVIVASVTASHLKLSSKIDVLEATNAQDHKYFKEALDDIKVAVVRGPSDNFADGEKITKRKKKAYAGELIGFDYVSDREY